MSDVVPFPKAVSLALVVAANLIGCSINVHAESVRLTMLYDAVGADPRFVKDWGFATLVEYGGRRILFDTGNDADIFAHNVRAAGIDLETIDFAVVSHRHGDHSSGLNHLLETNPDIVVYAPKENFGVFGARLPGSFYPRAESLPDHMRYFGGAARESLEFGSPWPDANFELVGETTEIAPGFHLIALNGHWGVDLEVVEISLAIETPVGLVLIIGCGHPTVERIVAAAASVADQPVYAIIGGLHLLPAPRHEVKRVARTLRDEFGVRHVAPSHCTGEHAFEIFREVFRDDYVYAGLGERIELPVADR